MPIKREKKEKLKKKKSYVTRITQLKNQVSKSKGVLCSPRTDTHTHTEVNTEDTLSGFQECFLQPIVKDRSNITLAFR